MSEPTPSRPPRGGDRGPGAALRAAVRALDRFLSRRMALEELSDDPVCLFRGRPGTADHPLPVEEGRIVPEGSPVYEIHLWSERVPAMPSEGPDVRWAVSSLRRLQRSCRIVAGHLLEDPRLADARAVGGVTPFFAVAGGGRDGGDDPVARGFFDRLGFTAHPHRHPLGRFGRFWENLYAWLLMWAYNPASVGHRKILGVRQTEIWMSREEFLRRHGPEPEESTEEKDAGSGNPREVSSP